MCEEAVASHTLATQAHHDYVRFESEVLSFSVADVVDAEGTLGVGDEGVACAPDYIDPCTQCL